MSVTERSRQLHIVGSGDKAAVEKIYVNNNQANEHFIDDVIDVSYILSMAMRETLGEPNISLAITRGGLPVGEALARANPNRPTRLVHLGGWKDRFPDPLPEELRHGNLDSLGNQLLAVGDTIAASGGSMVMVLRMIQAERFNNIAVIAPIVTEDAIDLITEAFPNAVIFTAYIEQDRKWVTIEGGKKVLFVGADNSLGDAGDMVIKSAGMSLKKNDRAFADSRVLNVLAPPPPEPNQSPTEANETPTDNSHR